MIKNIFILLFILSLISIYAYIQAEGNSSPTIVKESLDDIFNDINDSASETNTRYTIIPLSITLVFFYLISFILSKKKILQRSLHIKLWNYLLLLFFILTGSSGILLAFMKNYNIYISTPFNILFWHVESGIVMSIITLFHIILHINYFIKIPTRKKIK